MMRDFLCDCLDLIDNTASPATVDRLCERMRKLYDGGHDWVPDFADAVLRETAIATAVRKAVLESQRDGIQAKIDAIYRQAAERERGDA